MSLGVFDIGSNTILMTLGRKTSADRIEILLDIGDVIRLSEGLQDGKPLQAAAKARALETLGRFQKLALEKGVKDLIAAGTAAFRRASDGKEFAAEIQNKLGIPVRILTGDEEAAYSFASAKYDFGKDSGDLGMIDIGGGSTELVFGEKAPHFSLPIGTVRLTEKFVTSHPLSNGEWNQVRSEIRRALKEGIPNRPAVPETWVAVAATPASLAAVHLKLPEYDPKKVHGLKLKRETLEELIETLRLKSIPERNEMPGMHPKRSELLPVGGAILLECMDFLNLPEITISDHGLRYGILYESLS